tara:strand:+ start:183 stop:515 length:333 start_codon:yes stop_codon:yes gene_type:complete
MAGGEGFEPPLAESESAVLPLDDPPLIIFSITFNNVTYFLTSSIAVDIKVTQTTSNVTKLRTTRNVNKDISSKTAEKYKPRQHEYYIRDKKLNGFWSRVFLIEDRNTDKS